LRNFLSVAINDLEPSFKEGVGPHVAPGDGPLVVLFGELTFSPATRRSQTARRKCLA
jgi:hypothetical protein